MTSTDSKTTLQKPVPDAASALGELTALLQLTSPALPIGTFSYSQGLEAAVDAGIVADGPSAERWIGDGLTHVIGHAEAPVWALQYRNWREFVAQNGCRAEAAKAALIEVNHWFLASRESRELSQETTQMGWSLLQLAQGMGWGSEAQRVLLAEIRPLALPTVHAMVAQALGIRQENGLTAYCFSWLENQVAAALKAVPLGQVAGQLILCNLRASIATAVAEALRRADTQPPALSTFAPQMAILSSRHETQYSRLFRS